ncbi:MAG: hypothetical protein OEW75_18995 [Cyclobacteriaceae bacterium]|nr:hypothetical protein [Cyclobacteriaceae bacterium]
MVYKVVGCCFLILLGFLQTKGQSTYTPLDKFKLFKPTLRTKNLLHSSKNKPWKDKKGLLIEVNKLDTVFYDNFYLGQKVYLINNADSAINNINTLVPNIFLQSFDFEKNKWIDVTYVDWGFCQYGLEYFYLFPDYYVEVIMPKFNWTKKTYLKYVFKDVSNKVVVDSEVFYEGVD